MSCHWIWHEIQPIAHPGRVCNPHQNAEHVHQQHDDLPSHAHEVPARLDPTRSYKDRVTLLSILRDRHPYPFHGTGDAWFDHRDGLIVQTLWQDESGRDTTLPSGVLWSWWGNINWTLTMWQAQVPDFQPVGGDLCRGTLAALSSSRQLTIHRGPAMNKHIETTLPTATENHTSEATIEMLETIALEGVTGGCAACGNSACGTAGSQQSTSSFWRR